MSANFTPTMGQYSGVRPFRYWCQQILPLTFDDSLSYMELLAKVVNYLNKAIEDVSTAETDIQALHDAYVQLQDYVNNYIGGEEFKQDIEDALDEMAASGELDAILAPLVNARIDDVVADQIDGVVADQIGGAVGEQIGDVVDDWLVDHPEATTTVQDGSLTFPKFSDALKKNNAVIIDTTTNLLIATNLIEGMYVQTLGYHNPNDGGDALFVISDEADENSLLYFALPNNLYANCITKEIVLPRYGGTYVNEMVEAAIPFITRYQRNMIVLPPPNANHPGCRYYYDSTHDKNVYYWTVDDPILLDEHFSYADFYLNGEISAITEMEAVLKISDVSKPEDLNFISPVRVGGYHYGGVVHLVDHAVLIEGGARIQFNALQAGYAKNCVTLGGTNQNNTIEFAANYMEIGSHTEKGLNVNANATTYYNINQLRIQNALADNTISIYGRGSWVWSNINSLLITLGNSYGSTSTPFDLKTSAAKTENILRIGTARIGGKCIGTFDTGHYHIGSLGFSLPVGATSVLILKDYTYVVIDTMSDISQIAWDITTTIQSILEIGQVDYIPTYSTRNIFIGGVCYGLTYAAVIKQGLAYSPAISKLALIVNGSVVANFSADA